MVRQCQVCGKLYSFHRKLSFHRSSITTRLCFMVLVLNVCNALPTDLQPSAEKENGSIFNNSFMPWFLRTNYNMVTFATGIVVVGTGIALLTIIFFPFFGYKICYALGGCQNTLDNYVEHLIGVEGHTRRITKRDITQTKENNGMDYFMEFLKLAMREYDQKATNQRDERTRNNIMRLTPGSDHQIEKRSPLDYIEPVLVMMSKAYNEFVDPELKKNFKKRRFTR